MKFLDFIKEWTVASKILNGISFSFVSGWLIYDFQVAKEFRDSKSALYLQALQTLSKTYAGKSHKAYSIGMANINEYRNGFKDDDLFVADFSSQIGKSKRSDAWKKLNVDRLNCSDFIKESEYVIELVNELEERLPFFVGPFTYPLFKPTTSTLHSSFVNFKKEVDERKTSPTGFPLVKKLSQCFRPPEKKLTLDFSNKDETSIFQTLISVCYNESEAECLDYLEKNWEKILK